MKSFTRPGLTLYELWTAEVALAASDKMIGHINGSGYKEIVTRALAHLEEAARIMRSEPRNSLHGRLSQEMEHKLEKERARLEALPSIEN